VRFHSRSWRVVGYQCHGKSEEVVNEWKDVHEEQKTDEEQKM
jgi:hypothetical protein